MLVGGEGSRGWRASRRRARCASAAGPGRGGSPACEDEVDPNPATAVVLDPALVGRHPHWRGSASRALGAERVGPRGPSRGSLRGDPPWPTSGMRVVVELDHVVQDALLCARLSQPVIDRPMSCPLSA
jgi:hypothetical protein